MSIEQPTFTRPCPACGRRVPRRLEECRCGRALEALGDPQSPGPDGVSLRWVIAAVGIAAVAGAAALIVWYTRPDPTPPIVKAMAQQAQGTKPEGEGAPEAEAVVDRQPPSPSMEWPRNVPYLSVDTPEPVTMAVVEREGATGAGTEDEQSLERIAAQALPAVVLIETPGGRGTGFFVSGDTVLTNAHVVEGNAYVTLQFAAGERASARVAAVAADQDVAVLRLSSSRPGMQPLPLGTLSDIRVGQEVLAVGSPLGLQNTVTRGIVSAVRRAGAVTLVQTDAAINPGNSGGPILDRRGRAIAIATMKVADRAESLGFGVAIDHARALLETGSGAVAAAPAHRPAPASLDLGPAQPDATEAVRAQGLALFERVVTDAARRADSLDEYWERFSKVCLTRPVRTGGDRPWFAIWERGFPPDVVTSSCVNDFGSFRDHADAIRARLTQADEVARRAGVYPGSRRDLRARYRLDWDGWD